MRFRLPRAHSAVSEQRLSAQFASFLRVWRTGCPVLQRQEQVDLNRSRELYFEAFAIALLLVGLLAIGSGFQGIPKPWKPLVNQAEAAQTFVPSSYAEFYNHTLYLLGTGRYATVSYELGLVSGMYYPSSLSSLISEADKSIGVVNASVPLAQRYLNATETYLGQGNLTGAAATLARGCNLTALASYWMNEFAGPVTLGFENRAIPVNLYSTGQAAAQKLVSSVRRECTSLQGAVKVATAAQSANSTSPSGATYVFKINSTRPSFVTGSSITLLGQISRLAGVGKEGLSDIQVKVYIDGRNVASSVTGKNGGLNLTLVAPYVYVPNVSLWAVGEVNLSGSLVPVVSNTLLLGVNFTPTVIVAGDPPEVLPDSSFTAFGRLLTLQGVPVPFAPVNVSALGTWRMVSTNSTGWFNSTITVPGSAPDGLHYVYMSFAPQGDLGPSENFTSVIVYRIQTSVRALGPGIAISGFSVTLSGSISQGSGSTGSLAGTVELSTPWGNYETKSDANGAFNLTLTVPLSYLWGTTSLSVSVTPAQPYLSASSTSAGFLVLNPVILAAVGALGLVLGYELRSVRIKLPGPRAKAGGTEVGQDSAVALGSPRGIPEEATEPASLYSAAIRLASEHTGIAIAEWMSPREALKSFEAGGRLAEHETLLLKEITLAAETYFYSSSFEPGLIGAMSDALVRLKQSFEATVSSHEREATGGDYRDGET